MRYFYIPNLVSSSAAELPCKPWEAEVERPEFPSKDKFREWCRDASTKHAFLSLVEGLTPGLRIDRNNPAHILYGIIVDYDAKVGEDLASAAEKVSRRVPVDGHSPAYICATYSGGARLIFEFEKPLMVETAELAQEFLTLLSKKLALNSLLPGLDKTTLELNRYFEIGDRWVAIPGGGAPIPEDAVMTLLFEAGKRTTLTSSDTLIPIEEVAQAVEKFFPGRWPGRFELGARGPLFWLSDGVDRIGCQVSEHGVICYSDRAGKSFMTWRDIFGGEFIQAYTEKKIGDLTKRVWWDSKFYWLKGAKGWVPFTREDFRLFCKGAGFGDKMVKGKTVTEVEEVLLYVHEHRRVDAAVPFVFQRRERIHYNGHEFLNTNRRFAMPCFDDSSKGDHSNWPWLFSYLSTLFEDPHGDALPSFLAWLQRAYEGAITNHPVSGHVLIVAGPPGRGKTLLSQFILGTIFGGFADASDFLLKNNFNKELGEVGLWCVDDGTTTANFNDHKKFTEMLKRHVANPNITYHPKFKDATMMPWRGRIVITCNLDSDSLSVLPNMDTNILDKLMLFRISETTDETRRLFNDYDIEETIKKELPAFLTWLLHWDPPAHIVGVADRRYGVVPYHHPLLIEAARDANPDNRFVEVLDIFRRSFAEIEREKDFWEGTAAELMEAMSGVGGLSFVMRDYSARSAGRLLSKLASQYPSLIEKRKLKDGRQPYRIPLKGFTKTTVFDEDPVVTTSQ